MKIFSALLVASAMAMASSIQPVFAASQTNPEKNGFCKGVKTFSNGSAVAGIHCRFDKPTRAKWFVLVEATKASDPSLYNQLKDVPREVRPCTIYPAKSGGYSAKDCD